VILGLILALAYPAATNLAFLFKHRGAVLAPPIQVRHPLRSAVGLFRSTWFAVGWLVANRGLGPARRRALTRTAVDRAGSPLRRARLPRRVRRTLLRLSPRTTTMGRRDDHRGRTGRHRTSRAAAPTTRNAPARCSGSPMSRSSSPPNKSSHRSGSARRGVRRTPSSTRRIPAVALPHPSPTTSPQGREGCQRRVRPRSPSSRRASRPAHRARNGRA
jgi:hypothetical protein